MLQTQAYAMIKQPNTCNVLYRYEEATTT